MYSFSSVFNLFYFYFPCSSAATTSLLSKSHSHMKFLISLSPTQALSSNCYDSSFWISYHFFKFSNSVSFMSLSRLIFYICLVLISSSLPISQHSSVSSSNFIQFLSFSSSFSFLLLSIFSLSQSSFLNLSFYSCISSLICLIFTF